MASRVSTFTSAFALILGPPGIYTNVNLQRTTKLSLKWFVQGQEHNQLQANSASQDRPLKAGIFDFYYRYLHMEYYYFCWQCKDYFKTTGVTGSKRISFIASFFRDKVHFDSNSIKYWKNKTGLSLSSRTNSKLSATKSWRINSIHKWHLEPNWTGFPVLTKRNAGLGFLSDTFPVCIIRI